MRIAPIVLAALMAAATAPAHAEETTATADRPAEPHNTGLQATADEHEMARAERIRIHQAKINAIVCENRRKQEEAQRRMLDKQQKDSKATIETRDAWNRHAESMTLSPLGSLGRFAGIHHKLDDNRSALDATRPLVHVAYADVPLWRITDWLTSATGVLVLACGTTSDQRLSLIGKDLPLLRALDMIVKGGKDWVWMVTRREPCTVEIWDKPSWKARQRWRGALPGSYPESDTSCTVYARGEMPLERLAHTFQYHTGVTIVPRGTAPGRTVHIAADGWPVERIINTIAMTSGLIAYKPEPDGNTYELWDEPSFAREVLPRQTKQVSLAFEDAQAQAVADAVGLVLTPQVGSVTVDATYNTLIVRDLPHALERVRKLCGLIEPQVVELPPGTAEGN